VAHNPRNSDDEARTLLRAHILLFAATVPLLALAGCAASAPAFDPCLLSQDEVIATIGATVGDADVSDLTERGAYGDVNRMQCSFDVQEPSSGLSIVSFESISAAEGAAYRETFFDTSGELSDGSRVSMPEWGADAFFQNDGQFYIATFEFEERFWRLDVLIATTEGVTSDESTIYGLVNRAIEKGSS
jgi:hypothetical protein